MLLTGVNVGTQAISKAEDRAMAGCMYGFMRSLGMPIGVAVGSTSNYPVQMRPADFLEDSRHSLPECDEHRALGGRSSYWHRQRL